MEAMQAYLFSTLLHFYISNEEVKRMAQQTQDYDLLRHRTEASQTVW